jgi:hypothetical protein
MSFDLPTLQSIAGLAGSVVAIIAVYLSYRHNRGSKPVVVSTDMGILEYRPRDELSPPPVLVIIFEVWNRRKYPVVVEGVAVSFDRLQVLDPPDRPDDLVRWSRDGQQFEAWPTLSLDPLSHRQFSLGAPFEEPHARD